MSALFVKGFDFGTKDEALLKHFSAAGVIKEHHFQSRDSALITYEDASGASKAVADLNETTIEGQKRYVIVKIDDPDRPKGEGKGGGKKGKAKGEGKGGSAAPGRSIFVSGFDLDTDDAAVREHFGTVGAIEDLYFQSKRAAVITYVKEADAQEALTTLEGTTMSGQTHYVALKMDDPDRSAGKGEKGSGKASGKKEKGSGKASGKKGGDGSGRTVFVSGFDFGTDDAALEWHFDKMGAIEDYHFQSKGSAVITYVKAASAQRALAKLDGSTLEGQGRYVDVKLDDPDRDGGKGKAKGTGKGKAKGKDSGKGKGKGKDKGKGKSWSKRE